MGNAATLPYDISHQIDYNNVVNWTLHEASKKVNRRYGYLAPPAWSDSSFLTGRSGGAERKRITISRSQNNKFWRTCVAAENNTKAANFKVSNSILFAPYCD